ncbi:unnamed protein product [Kluyveromyces dobzhanskii CBS 2104]|uniref:WGS project CCBQ000000000 data, contig 00058 n=1 Tax=Kluyveromyces dobzhanskii CBS 2104 TaxID=1427455 RepID=A0A0A8LDT5_9SACH|nr:unnamed protein product [Kluyveromyces dobzhanskii CBS 2104]
MFGASRPAFGQTSTSPFGQQTQSASNAFGQQPSGTTNNLFGSSSANNAQSGFGGFGTNGANTNPTQAMNSPFGMSQQQNTTTSPFGGASAAGPNNASSNPPSLFGGSQSSGTATGALSSGPLSGTGIKPFQPYTEKDVSTGYPSVFQSITSMSEYSMYSFEELRFQDYQENRKFSSTAGGLTTSAIASPFGQQQTNGTNNNFGSGNKNTIGATGTTPFGQQPTNSPFGQQPVNAFSQPNNAPFGQSQQPQQTSGMFGQQQNSSPFGQNNATGSSPFGLNKSATSGGLFGQNTTNNNSAFGQTNNPLFGQQNQPQNQSNAFGQNTGTNAFGGSFGQTNNNPSGGLFGQNNTASTNTGGLFGQQNNGNSAFGQNNNNAGGLFGAKPAGTTGGGLFNQQSQTGPTPFGQQNTTGNSPFGQTNSNQGGGMFGQNNSNAGGNLFSQQQPSNTGSGGLFGQQNNTANTGGLFGQQPNSATNQQGGGLFGAKPAASGGIFGQNNSNQQGSTGFFGGQNKPAIGGSAGLFGQNNQPQQSGGMFGQNTQQPATGGLFSNQNQQQQQPASGGLFGQQNNTANNNTGGLFNAKPAGTTGGLFGQNNQQQNPSGGLFGQNNQQNNTATGGLFGQNNQQPGNASGGLFGAKPAGSSGLGNNIGGIFGGNTQQQNSSGGLFGSKPADSTSNSGGLFSKPSGGLGGTSGGLFGAKPAGTSSFDVTNSNNNTLGGGGLFGGNKPANTGSSGLFAPQNNSAGNGNAGGLFNSSSLQQNQQSQNQQQPAQPNSNPYGTDELFSRVISIPNSITQPTKPSATKVSADLKKKTSLSAAYKLVPKPLFNTKKSEPNSMKAKIHLKLTKSKEEDSANSTALTRRSANSSIFTEATDEVILNTGELLFNPDRKSFKNLIINRQRNEKEGPSSGDVKFITLNEEIESPKKVEQNENTDIFHKLQDTPVGKNTDPLPDKENFSVIDEDKHRKAFHKSNLTEEDISFTENGYYISPSFETLESLTLMEVRKVSNLVVGHQDYGKIEFMEPVDLSLIPLPSICGKLVIFENRCCTVSHIGDKPEKGQGLNVKAKITLAGCYPKDKSSGKPIKDPNHPILKKHIENLKSMKEALFESYDPETGSWTFVTEEPIL